MNLIFGNNTTSNLFNKLNKLKIISSILYFEDLIKVLEFLNENIDYF
jgi:hypothetical protein